jgi:CHAD domain-containing protein
MAKYSKWIQAAPGDPLDQVAVRSLRSRLDPLEHYVPLAASGSDENIEYVHQMRVWSRRAAAALRLYKELLPKRRRKWLNRTLKTIRGAAGDARDDDVFALRLAADAEDPRAARLLGKVREHRASAQRPIVRLNRKLMQSGLFERKVRKLLGKVRFRGRPEECATDFHAWAVRQLDRHREAFFAASLADFSDYANLHRFRIAGKQLRYAVELLAPAFGDALQTETYPLIENLQDRLGEINDHAAAAARLDEWAKQVHGKELQEYLAALQRQEEARMANKRAAFLDWWSEELAGRLHEGLAGK